MRFEKILIRLGGMAVAAAVATAAAPAVAASADTTPSPVPSTSSAPTGSVSPGASSSATPSAPATTVTTSQPATTAPTTPTAAGPSVVTRAAAAGSAPKAAAWLVTQLTDGDHVEGSYVEAGKTYTYADDGDTADIAFSLASTGTQDATLVKVVRYLETDVSQYADLKGADGGPFIGALGKLALVAEATGQDPHHFGGYDLPALIMAHVCAAAISGQFTPCTAAGDFYNAGSPISQELDVLALERAGVAVPPTALARLLSLQCTDGGFAGELTTAAVPCVSDADSTGYAAQALVLDTAATAQVTAASQYLLGSQLADGGWYGASSTAATDANANSTALAVEALLAGPPATLTPKAVTAPRVVSTTAVAAGEALLAGLQHTDGALQISPATKPAADDLLATDQSVPAIAGADLTTLSHPVSLAVTTASPTPSATVTSTPTVAPTTPVAAISDGPTAGGTLPRTGADASLWSEIAALLLVVGGGLLVGGQVLRRRGAHR